MKTSRLIKTISLALIIATTLPTMAWAKKAPIIVPPSQMQFEPKAKYVIDLKNSKSVKTTGRDAKISGNTLIINNPKTGESKNIDIDSVNKIHKRKGSSKLVGLGIGAAVGGGLFTAISLTGKCTGDEPGDCAALSKGIALVGIPVGIVGGGLIGMAVGAALKKDEVYIFSPIISPIAGNQTYGLGMTKTF